MSDFLDPDVVEAAAMAHDLGHPPFGHVAEKELDSLMVERGVRDGFEGNAQSFRIVTKLAMRREGSRGLNLTRATLAAMLKYPWPRGRSAQHNKKWGAYDSEKDVLAWARALYRKANEEPSVEANIMDWADDVTYAVHDLADFYQAGLIPLNLFYLDPKEIGGFMQGVFERNRDIETKLGATRAELETLFLGFLQFFPLRDRYLGTQRHRGFLRAQTAGMIKVFLNAVDLSLPSSSTTAKLHINPSLKSVVSMLKELTLHYVVMHPSLATQQHGQKKIIKTLFEIFTEAARDAERRNLFPFAFRELVERAKPDKVNPLRIVCDFIASMSERQAINLFHRLTGVSLGSATGHATLAVN